MPWVTLAPFLGYEKKLFYFRVQLPHHIHLGHGRPSAT